MITIDNRSSTVLFQGNVSATLRKYYKGEHAFIGKVGDGPENSVYLISFNQIFLLEIPWKTWTGHVHVTINRFVDLKVEVVQRT